MSGISAFTDPREFPQPSPCDDTSCCLGTGVGSHQTLTTNSLIRTLASFIMGALNAVNQKAPRLCFAGLR